MAKFLAKSLAVTQSAPPAFFAFEDIKRREARTLKRLFLLNVDLSLPARVTVRQ